MLLSFVRFCTICFLKCTKKLGGCEFLIFMLKLSYFLDLFGIRGGPPSVIHVMADELQKCKAVLEVRNNVVVSYGPFPSFIIAFLSIRK